MDNFNFVNSNSRKSWLFKKNFTQTFIILAIVCVGFLIIAFLLLFQNNSVMGGISQIIFGLVLFVISYLILAKIASPKVNGTNLVDRFSDDLIELCEELHEESRQEGITEISPEYFFQKVSLTLSGKIIFVRLGIPFSQTDVARQKFDNPVFSTSLIQAVYGVGNKKQKIDIEDLLLEISQGSETIQDYLSSLKLDQTDLENVANWVSNMKKAAEPTRFWQKSFAVAGIAEEWSFGYTTLLNQYSRDLSVYFQDPNLTVNTFSHASKLNDIQSILARHTKNNCLLVGEPGVGKKSIVNALAAKIAHGDCLETLKYEKIRQIDVARLIGGGSTNDLVERIDSVFNEAINAGNIIIYIDNLESLLGYRQSNTEEVGEVDASGVLLPFFENSSLRIIASVSPDNYFSRVRNNLAVASSFEKVDVEPATTNDTLSIMLESVTSIEKQYNAFIPYQTLRTIVELADRYVHDTPFPEKALRMLDEAAVSLAGSGKITLIDSNKIEKFISKKVNVPIGQAGEGEKEKLLNLENLLHARVVGQNEAVGAVSDALRRVRAGITSGKRPVGVFLFLGPTGVGKTETAKALAESYFGSEKNMIRLDMSEYQESNSIDRLLGSASNPSGVLTDAIMANPFSLILLDEIEKADKNILNIFLQVFEDGRLTNARGRVSDFTNSIIIATSNAGSEFIRENVANMRSDQLEENLVNNLQTQGIFSPEFLNRFDAAIVYRPLTLPELQKVATLMLNDINSRLVGKKISVIVAPDALTKLVELGNDPQFGARPMRRVIQQKVENLLAKKMLEGSIAEGGVLNITLADLA